MSIPPIPVIAKAGLDVIERNRKAAEDQEAQGLRMSRFTRKSIINADYYRAHWLAREKGLKRDWIRWKYWSCVASVSRSLDSFFGTPL